jgi:hypothetical protein
MHSESSIFSSSSYPKILVFSKLCGAQIELRFINEVHILSFSSKVQAKIKRWRCKEYRLLKLFSLFVHESVSLLDMRHVFQI